MRTGKRSKNNKAENNSRRSSYVSRKSYLPVIIQRLPASFLAQFLHSSLRYFPTQIWNSNCTVVQEEKKGRKLNTRTEARSQHEAVKRRQNKKKKKETIITNYALLVPRQRKVKEQPQVFLAETSNEPDQFLNDPTMTNDRHPRGEWLILAVSSQSARSSLHCTLVRRMIIRDARLPAASQITRPRFAHYHAAPFADHTYSNCIQPFPTSRLSPMPLVTYIIPRNTYFIEFQLNITIIFPRI